MRVLIVNGYPSTPQGKESFAKFQEIVQEALSTQKDALDIQFEFIIRGKNDLDDFLYELDSAYSYKQAALSFDHLDMIFMEGDPNLLPWSPSTTKMLILLRMCMRAKKTLFASSFAMQALVFLAATNVEKQIHVINGAGKGGKIGDILTFNQNLYDIKPDSYFLDNVTGDLYGLHAEKEEWVPKMNVGLHHAKAAQSFDSVGKFIIKTPTYKPKARGDHSLTYVSKDIEDICSIKKLYLQHWVLHALPSEFKVPAKNNWHIHQFNFVNPNKTFIVMAESSRCPEVIYFDSFCVGTLFNITRKYPQTLQLLYNFISTKIKEIKSTSKKDFIGIERATIQLKGLQDLSNFQKTPAAPSNSNLNEKLDKLPKSKRSSQRASSIRILRNSNGRPQTAIYHSGLAITHHDGPPLLVENNAVRTDLTIKVGGNQNRDEKHASMKSYPLFSQSPYGLSEIKFDYPRTVSADKFLRQTQQTQQTRCETANPLSHQRSHHILKPKMSQDIERENSFSNYLDNKSLLLNRTSTQGILKNSKLFGDKSASEVEPASKNKGEVMMLLYPDISRSLVQDAEAWVPGQMSQSKLESRPSTSKKKIVRIEKTTTCGFYSSFSKFKELDIDEGRATPCINKGTEYLSPDEKYRKEQKESSKKNLGPNFFKFALKATKPNFIPNYVSMTPSQPPVNHKFREEIKKKWLAGNMKPF